MQYMDLVTPVLPAKKSNSEAERSTLHHMQSKDNRSYAFCVFETQSWQRDACGTYYLPITQDLPPEDFCNVSGEGIPDL